MSSNVSDVAQSARHTCRKCLQKFGQRYNLNQHIRAVHKVFPEDPDNGEAYFNAGGTTRLSNNDTKGNPGPRMCKRCGDDFVEQGNLNAHIRTVHKLLPGDPKDPQAYFDAGGTTRLSNSQSKEASRPYASNTVEQNQSISQDRPSVGSSTQPTPIHQFYASYWPPERTAYPGSDVSQMPEAYSSGAADPGTFTTGDKEPDQR